MNFSYKLLLILCVAVLFPANPKDALAAQNMQVCKSYKNADGTLGIGKACKDSDGEWHIVSDSKASTQSTDKPKDLKKLCLEPICIGMTIPEILATNVQLISPPEDKNLKDLESIDALKEVMAADKKAKEEKLETLQGLSKEEKAYLASSEGTRKALELFDKAKWCSYFPIEIVYLSKNGEKTVADLHPLDDNLVPKVTIISRDFKYAEIQVPELSAEVHKQFSGYKIGASSFSSDYSDRVDNLSRFPDVLFFKESQRLILLDRRIWKQVSNLEGPTAGFPYAGGNESFDDLYAQKNGCLKKPSIE